MMFASLSDAALASLIARLQAAVIDLALGEKTVQFTYEGSSEQFNVADPNKAQDLLNKALAEQTYRSTGCRGGGAIFPVGV